MRWTLPLLALALGSAALADHIFAGIQWPGWHIQTDEVTCSAAYPLMNLLDGSPETAWVFHKQDYVSTEANGPGTAFNHGIGRRLTIAMEGAARPAIDGIVLTNGYAKDSDTYWRNNRIREVTVTLYGSEITQKRYPLRETREPQRLDLGTPVRRLVITFDTVDVGKDDDLCVSDLTLYAGSTPIPWGLTPTVLGNGANYDCGCGGGPTFSLLYPSGQPFLVDGQPFAALGYAPVPDEPLLLLAAEHDLLVVNLVSQRVLFQRHFSGFILHAGWLSRDTGLIGTAASPGDWEHQTWFRLSRTNGYALTPAPDVPPQAPFVDGWRYLPGWMPMGYPV